MRWPRRSARGSPKSHLADAGLPAVGIWPKLDQIIGGTPPELAALATVLVVSVANAAKS